MYIKRKTEAAAEQTNNIDLINNKISHSAENDSKRQKINDVSEQKVIASRFSQAVLVDNNLQEAQFLLDKYPSLVSHMCGNINILQSVAEKGNVKAVKLLLKHGTNLNAVTRNGNNVLHIAAYYGHAEVLNIF